LAYASQAGGSEGLRKTAGVIAAIDNNQPVPKFDETPGGGQTQSKSVKPPSYAFFLFHRFLPLPSEHVLPR
jgi:hypothetical protein